MTMMNLPVASVALNVLVFTIQQNTVLSSNDETAFQRQRVVSHLGDDEKRIQEEDQQNIFRDIWEAEAFLAEREAERLLNGDIFQMSSFPPTPPPVSPTPPTPGTPSPTSEPQPSQSPTVDTSCLNGRTREQFLLDELSLITDPSLLQNPATPQGEAFDFMRNDPLDPNVCTYPTIDQRYGLATLFYSTDGANWLDQQGWLQAQGECEWFGVVCNDGVLASNLTLVENNLIGPLPQEISTLYGMTQLQLSSNTITGSIPLGISNQTELCVLDLEMNQLSGNPIGPQILVLQNLKQLFLSENLFARERIPAEINLLTNLTDLWMATNGLEGPIPPEIGDLTDLKSLLLYRNELTGSIPSQIGNLVEMTNLQLFQNVLVNSIPEQFYNMNQLTTLRMNRNFLTGTISASLGNLVNLIDLRMDDNFVSSSLPNSFGQLTKLQVVSFSVTRLDGTIPNVFSNFDDLRILDFSLSRFSGPLPSSIFNAPAIELLYLNGNQLTGAIPASYANPPLLEDLYLDNNQLNGPVPAISSGQLLTLNEFTMERNSITGTMPQSVCDLRTVGILDNLFSDCGGPTPEIVCPFPACCTRCFQD